MYLYKTMCAKLIILEVTIEFHMSLKIKSKDILIIPLNKVLFRAYFAFCNQSNLSNP